MVSKLYLHVGHGKTGSSYIQSCLAKSKHLLDKNRICYPINEQERLIASIGHISSGNGCILLEDDYKDVIKDSIHSNHEALLFSNETLMTHIVKNTNDIQTKIHEMVAFNGIKEINILLLIRNPLELASSVYQQAVKRSCWYLGINEYLDHYIAHSERVLAFMKLIKQWDNVSLKILNYSVSKYKILSEVEDWLDKVKLEIPDTSIVNRSLTRGEIELLLSLNKNLGTGGALLADPLCEKLPNIRSDVLTLSSDAKKIFLKRIEPLVLEINTMIDSENKLTLQDPSVNTQHDNNQFMFTKDQVRVIGESFAHFIAKHNEEANLLRESHRLLSNSLPFRISKKLNNFPSLKKLMKKLFQLRWVKQYY